jgi:hypothetical protein
MSDNPDLISFGIEPDESGFQVLNQELSSLQEHIAKLQEQALTALGAGAEPAYDLVKRLDELNTSTRSSTANFAELKVQVDGVAASLREAQTAMQVGFDYSEKEIAKGFGAAGGMIGPAELGPFQPGSMFGVGHALSVTGFMTGAPGLKEAGAFVYMEEGLKRVTPLFEQLNNIILETPSVLTPLTSGLSAMGIPMAGLLTVVVPIAAAIAGIALAFKAFNDGLADVKRALEAALSTQKGYYDFAQTATTEQAQDQMLKLNNQADAARKARDETERALQGLESQTNISRNVGIALPGAVGDPFRMLTKQLDDNKKAVAEAEAAVGRLTGGLESNAFAANDAAAAALKNAEITGSYEKQIVADQQMTGKQAEQRLKSLQDENQVIADQMNVLQPYIATNAEAKKKYEDLNVALTNNNAEIDYLTTAGLDLAKAHDAEAEAAKRDEQAVKEVTKAHEEYNKAIQSAQDQLAKQTADARTRESQQETQYQPGSLQDTFERNKIRLEESRKETTLAEDNANAIADARTKLGQKEQQLAIDYNRQLFDDDVKFRSDWSKLEVDAQAKQREDLSNHYNKLDDINRQSTHNQEQALLDRNFLALAKNEASKQQQIDQENLSFSRREGQLNEHLHQQEIDLVNNLMRERQQQQTAYERKLADAQLQTQNEIIQQETNEQRKLMALRNSESQQLSDLTTMENYKIQVLRQGLANELILYQQQEQQRLQIAQQTQAQLISQAWSTIGANFATNPTAAIQAAWQMAPSTISSIGSQLGGIANRVLGMPLFDAGGSFGPGEMFAKGAGPETLRIGSGSYMIPGAAMIMPFQSGSASGISNNNSNAIQQTFNISESNNAQVTAQLVSQIVLRELGRFFNTP